MKVGVLYFWNGSFSFSWYELAKDHCTAEVTVILRLPNNFSWFSEGDDIPAARPANVRRVCHDAVEDRYWVFASKNPLNDF